MHVGRIRNCFLSAAVLVAALTCDAAAEGGKAAPDAGQSPPKAFLERYCFECHDSDTHKAGLVLDGLPFDLAQRTVARQWEGVFDKLDSGQMPPKKADQPSAEERAALAKSLSVALQDASLTRQQVQGRTMLRRLNRSQYEDTVRDLLALPALDVKELLPEESPVAGFDNVSAGQSISGVHLVRYQQAADKALDAAVPRRTFDAIHVNKTGRELMGSEKQRKEFETWKCWLKGDGLVIPSKLWRPHLTVATPPAPVAGRYRIRVTGYGIHTGGSPLPVAFNYLYSQQLQYGQDLAWRDLPADKPGTAEVELELQKGQVVDVQGWTLPHRDEVKNKLKNEPGESWTGPSMVIDRLEVEGPLDTWPPESYRRLFGDLPLKTAAEVSAEKDHTPAPKSRGKRTAERLAERSADGGVGLAASGRRAAHPPVPATRVPPSGARGRYSSTMSASRSNCWTTACPSTRR